MPAEDGGHQVRHRLARAGAGLGQQHAAVRRASPPWRRPCGAVRREARTGAALAPAGRRRQTRGLPRRRDGRIGTAGTSDTVARPRLSPPRPRPASSGAASTRAMSAPMAPISAARMPRVVIAGVPRRIAAGHHRRIGVEGNRVLVDRDAGAAERGLGDLAGEALREDVDQHQVVVGAAADHAEAGARPAPAASACALATTLALVVGELRLGGLPKHTALAAMMCISGPPCTPGNTRAVDRPWRSSCAAQDQAAARAAQRLVRGGRDEVGVRHRDWDAGPRRPGRRCGPCRP